MDKKCAFVCLFMGLFLLPIITAQTAPDQNTPMTLYQSAHYEVEAAASLAGSDVEAMVYQLEANYTLFSEMFTQATQRPEDLLHVKIYADKESFNQALAPQKVYNRNNYIYLYYNDPAQNVLIIYPIDNENEERAQLARHSFFSYAFDSVPTLPAWLREGLALYYESLIYEEDGKAIVPYNHLYLDDLKKAAQEEPLNLKDLMMLSDEDGKFEKNQFEKNLLYSWGIVNYLMFSDNEADRSIIGEALAMASKDNTQTENSQAIMDFIFSRKPALEADFSNFLDSQMGYVEMLDAMREAYAQREFERAKNYAENAAMAHPEAYVPVYYLGLIAFENQEYEIAKEQYNKALELGAPQALIDFVMGYVYYYGDANYSEAAAAFQRAKTQDATRYGQKVDMLLRNLQQDSQSPYSTPENTNNQQMPNTIDASNDTNSTQPTQPGSNAPSGNNPVEAETQNPPQQMASTENTASE